MLHCAPLIVLLFSSMTSKRNPILFPIKRGEELVSGFLIIREPVTAPLTFAEAVPSRFVPVKVAFIIPAVPVGIKKV